MVPGAKRCLVAWFTSYVGPPGIGPMLGLLRGAVSLTTSILIVG